MKPHPLWLASLSLCASLLVGYAAIVPPQPLPRAHAHNDYLHPRPLLDALDRGFGSVEADIFLVDGELLVAHTRQELDPERTLRRLYLEPLRARVQENQGSVFGTDHVLTLLIDIKADGPATYRALDQLLEEYRDLFAHTDESGELHHGPVQAIISGERPVELVAADKTRFVGIDGRLSDLDNASRLLPLISDNWNLHFSWRGEGEISAEERQKLHRIVERAHDKGRRIRFWAVPDHPNSWQVLYDAGVDLINTDDLDGLSQFLRKQ
jgi:hypothetical protein